MSSDRPIFIVGHQRSGTTLLQSLLGAHPRIAAAPELHFAARVMNFASYFGSLEDDEVLRTVVAETLDPPLPIIDDAGWDAERIYRRALATDRSYPSLFRVLMDDFAERAGKPRWSEKSPGQGVRLSLSLCNEAQIIHIVRNPSDVLASTLAMPWTIPRSLWLHSRNWRRRTASDLRAGLDAGPESYLLVRYEDLIREPATVLRRICTFLDEEFTSTMVADRPEPIRPPGQPTWIDNGAGPVRPRAVRAPLTRAQRARVAAVTGELAAGLGYGEPRRGQVVVGRILDWLATLGQVSHAAEHVRFWVMRGDHERTYRRVKEVQRTRAKSTQDELETSYGGPPVPGNPSGVETRTGLRSRG